MAQNPNTHQKIYLENDAPGVFPTETRKSNWGNEAVQAPVAATAPDLDANSAKFLTKFISASIKTDANGNVDPDDLRGIFLRFHLHKDLILQLLAQGGDCFGLAINLGTKEYLYKEETEGNTKVEGIGITITAIGKNMEDIGITPNRNIVLFTDSPSPCPPTNPCPAQGAVGIFFQNPSFNTSLISQ